MMDENEKLLEKSLNEKSPAYDKLYPKWKKAEILYEGEDSVHEAGTLLLPMLAQQDQEMYDAYVERTRFFNALKRTISGLEGTVKRKDADDELDPIEDFVEDIDGAGTTIDEYADKLLHQAIKIGVCGTLVDYNKSTDDDEDMTVAQAEDSNMRPKLAFYEAKDIYYPRYGVVAGKKQLILVTLHETYKKKVDEFTYKEYEQFRVLRLNDEGNYEQQLYRIKENDIEILEPIVMEKNGEKLKAITFYIHGKYEEPPLYDLITTNVKHYQLKADHNHCLHFIGLPTPVRTGVDPSDKKLPSSIGPDMIWDIESKDAKCFYLELEGKGLSNIVTELETIKEDMAFLGAAMLASDQMVNETATKANFRNASDTSSLTDIVVGVSYTFTQALKMFADWAGAKNFEDVYYSYNDDFDLKKLTAQDILARVQGWMSGGFSKRSLHKQLKEGEVELVGEAFEDEEELINKGE